MADREQSAAAHCLGHPARIAVPRHFRIGHLRLPLVNFFSHFMLVNMLRFIHLALVRFIAGRWR